MPKYNVLISQSVDRECRLTVEADNEEQAEKEALTRWLNDAPDDAFSIGEPLGDPEVMEIEEAKEDAVVTPKLVSPEDEIPF